MKCSKCGQDYAGNFCPNCGTPAPGNAETPPQPKKKKKFHWWYVLIILLVLGAIGSMGDDLEDSTNDAAQTPAPSKETAESNDLMIYTTLEMAERYLGIFQDALNGLGDGSATILDVYNTCEDVKQYMIQFDNHLDEVVDDQQMPTRMLSADIPCCSGGRLTLS